MAVVSTVLIAILLLAAQSNGNIFTSSPLTAMDPVHGITNHVAENIAPLDEEILNFVQKLTPALVFNQSLSNDNLNLSSCVTTIGRIAEDLKDHKSLYAIQILDSWAKLESGVLKGNLNWMGRYHECIGASTPQHNITTQYCSTHFGKPPAPGQLGMTGLSMASCFPRECSTSNISNIFQAVANLTTLNLQTSVHCPVQFEKWEFKDILGLLVLIFFVCIVLAATLYEYISSIIGKKHEQDTEVLYTDALNGHAPQFKTEANKGMAHKLILAFSAIENTKRLLNTEQRPGDIHCLHGMRFISMSWVILGHSFLFVAYYANNLLYPASYLTNHVDFQAIVNGTFSVDSFFYISGLLAAYLGLRQLKKTDGKINVPLMYLLRYIRLTPAYAFCMLMSISIWPKFGEGPIWPVLVRPLVENCQKYWWSSLLYINNLYPSVMESECYAWGWYLANDTQFYLLLPIFLVLLYRFPRVGIFVTIAVMVDSVTVTGIFSSLTKQQPQIVTIGQLAGTVLNPKHSTLGAGAGAGNGTTPTDYSIYLSDLYTKPWCRIGAYLVGVLTGYVLHTYKGKIRMPKAVALLGWACAAAINCSIVYGLYPTVREGGTLSVNTAAFYNAVARPMWCIGLAWVTVACVSGYGGPIDNFLSWKGFIPLSRLTYCCYLLHPLIIWWFFGTQEVLVHYSIPYVLSIFIGSLVLAHLFGFAVHLLVEAPVIIITKTLTGKLTEQKATMTTTNHLQFANNSITFEGDSTA